MSLEQIIAHGTRDADYRPTQENWLICADGFKLSVIAGTGAYCTPRPDWPFGEGAPADYPGPYAAVEVGFPSERPEPWEPIDGALYWSQYAENENDPTGTVYGYVPVALVRALVRSHGGES
jgi:hypothetical protein